MPDCVFCKIVSGELPSRIVHQGELVTAFRDLNPQAPVHVLIVPNQHIGGVNDLTAEHTPILAALFAAAKKIASDEGLAQNGYRLVLNQGSHGGQTVVHLHLHLLGGRRMIWPPG
ncbi:MAG: histidine triad nucleotide-binding protein [Chloroflexi bacterium]|nr:histidine triad nucleotide-binding protein [Chloroflexota bacterium]